MRVSAQHVAPPSVQSKTVSYATEKRASGHTPALSDDTFVA